MSMNSKPEHLGGSLTVESKMRDQAKTKEQLIDELAELRRQVAELQASEAQLRRTETALRESEARFRDLYDDAPIGYHELDAEGRIIRVNRTELALLGY